MIARILLLLLAAQVARGAEPLKVGILHSLSGTMAISERSLVDAVQMAIAEVNAAGGVLGRPLVGVLEDGASDPATFARKAARLIEEDRVAAVFGCWTSSARKAVLPVLEKADHLLFYPVQYEGEEAAPQVIYCGSTPEQQILPAVAWCRKRFGKRCFLVGSDYVFPRTANRRVRGYLERTGGECAGEEYRPLGDADFSSVIEKIKACDPDFVLNTVNGDSNVAFFRALAQAGIGPLQIPVMSVSIAEDELTAMGGQLAADHYVSWSYFQSLDTEANRQFVASFKRVYGAERVTDDPIASAYAQVHLFAAAAAKAGRADPRAVRAAARGLEVDSPLGRLRVDSTNQHLWKPAHVGQIEPSGQVRVLWSSGPLDPAPFGVPSPGGTPPPGPAPSSASSPAPRHPSTAAPPPPAAPPPSLPAPATAGTR